MKHVTVRRSDGAMVAVPLPRGVNLDRVKRYFAAHRAAVEIPDSAAASKERVAALKAMDVAERALNVLDSAFIAAFMEAMQEKGAQSQAAAVGGEVDGGEAKASEGREGDQDPVS